MSGGYHEAYAISQVNRDDIVCIEGHYYIFNSMQAAAKKLAGLALANPTKEFTIRPFHMAIPWSKQGF